MISRDSMPSSPTLMGIVNVTPDSFSDGGQHMDPSAAVEYGLKLVDEGAGVLDVGGESTRPGADPVSNREELRRVIPVVEGLAARLAKRGDRALISVDTSKPEVASASLKAGARIVNDVTALRDGPEIAELCARFNAGLVLMHMLGDPKTMQDAPTYHDVVEEVFGFLSERAERAVSAGVDRERVWLDPGIGFGKSVDHNLVLLANLERLVDLGYPVLVGTSRKGFLGSFDSAPADQRIGGTIASCLAAWERGASALRVHDVQPVRQALALASAIRVA